MLRRPAMPIPRNMWGTIQLRNVADALRNTARTEGAVGLAAQQCGIDARLVFLDDVPTDDGEGSFLSLLQRWRSRGKNTGATVAMMGEGAQRGGGGGGQLSRGGPDGYNDDKGGDDNSGGGLFLVNPRIVSRSPEVDMRCWTEKCLVLPPTFVATVLRDSTVDVEYETLDGVTTAVRLDGELARAAQHELDHDRGVLLMDHVDLNEMETDVMRRLERDGHESRMMVAYERYMSEPTSQLSSSSSVSYVATATPRRKRGSTPLGDLFVRPAEATMVDDEATTFAADTSKGAVSPPPSQSSPSSQDAADAEKCDEACREKRRQVIEERRAMMRQSRSATKRQDVFELSKQRAKLYDTTYRGADCPPGGVPCL